MVHFVQASMWTKERCGALNKITRRQELGYNFICVHNTKVVSLDKYYIKSHLNHHNFFPFFKQQIYLRSVHNIIFMLGFDFLSLFVRQNRTIPRPER